MNTPNPLIPQGTIPAKGKSTFFFKVLMVLAVHVVVIGGMLLQGCKDTSKDNTSNPPADTSTAATDNSVSNPPPIAPTTVSNNVVSLPVTSPAAPMAPAGGTSTVATAPIAPLFPTPAAPPVAPAASAESKEYSIVSGDTLGALAKRNGISLKTLLDANPGINPRKLKVGQKVQIPGGSGGGATMDTAAAGGAATDTGDTTTYTVKSGDTLSKIAKANHTSYRKLMALNDLKTTSIKVGQKLKLPVKAAPVVDSGVPAAAAPTPPAAPAVVPLQPSAPAATTAAAAPSTTQQ